MKHGFVKVATATPKICVADPAYNEAQLYRLAKEANDKGVGVLVFPELVLTGATAADLYFSDTLLNAAISALIDYRDHTKELSLLSIVGLPVRWNGKLYNCAAVVGNGQIYGIVPKSHIPASGVSCESRYFHAPYTADWIETLTVDGKDVFFGARQIFACKELPALRIAVELGSDLSAPMSPAIEHTAAGATLICCPAASPETVGSRTARKSAVLAQSACLCTAYAYVSAGAGESTTDLVMSGHALLAENGTLLAETAPLTAHDSLTVTEFDIERIEYERRRNSLFSNIGDNHHCTSFFSLPIRDTVLTRPVDPHPFMPCDGDEQAERCQTILSIQSAGLQQRIERAFAKKLVLGISGGLDSTLALLVSVRAMDALKRPRKDIIAVTMPCFGTTKRTKNNATVLCEELGVDFRSVDIFDAVNLHFRDIGHDPLDRNVTYENAQARERTQILMDVANDCGGMVIGTGDLSELALGWATYNGDQMSMYGVNASIPKTLVRHLVAFCADEAEADGQKKVADALRDVLNTPVSPELLPANENGEITQKTEDLVGPYELHDFYLFYLLRYGFSPSKLLRLSAYALGDRYDQETRTKWLKTLLRRFFSQQFKRSCAPDGPAVGSVSLSPRGAWQMPSDASSAAWLAELEKTESDQ